MHGISVLIASASSEGSGESVHRPLAWLDWSVWAFMGGICANAMNTEILCNDTYRYLLSTTMNRFIFVS